MTIVGPDSPDNNEDLLDLILRRRLRLLFPPAAKMPSEHSSWVETFREWLGQQPLGKSRQRMGVRVLCFDGGGIKMIISGSF